MRSLRLHGAVARDLGIRILSGALAPGELLEGEISASGQLSVSRTAYREAIRTLAAKGLVHARPKIGTQVSPRGAWHLLDPDVLSWTFADRPDPQVIFSLFELRRMVEPDAARLAAKRRTEDQLARMKAGIDAMVRHGLAEEAGRVGDQQFHTALLQASHNAFLLSLASGVGAAVALTTEFKSGRLPTPRDPVPDHVAVFRAIARGNAQAAHDAMGVLIDLALRDTMEARRGPSVVPLRRAQG